MAESPSASVLEWGSVRPVPFCSLLLPTAASYVTYSVLSVLEPESYFFRLGWLADAPATASQVLGLLPCATEPGSSALKGLTVVEEKELAL